MSEQKFLSADEFMALLQAELPAGVFADDFANDPDPAKRSVSSSELRAVSTMLEIASNNLSLVYSDKFLQTVTREGLAAWEKDFFDSAQDSSLPTEVRRQNLISKIRSTGGISYPAIKSLVAGILDPIPFDLLPFSGQMGGAWSFGVSPLGVSTYLAELDPILGARTEGGTTPINCARDYAAAGLSEEQLRAIERTAYTFEVRIYGNASQATLNLLDARLVQYEPARSTHVIRNNQAPVSYDPAAYRAATPEFERLRLG